MIRLTKINREVFLVNHNQIACIELIPECKIVMMNRDYYLVRESVDQILQKIADHNAKVLDFRRRLIIKDENKNSTFDE